MNVSGEPHNSAAYRLINRFCENFGAAGIAA